MVLESLNSLGGGLFILFLIPLFYFTFIHNQRRKGLLAKFPEPKHYPFVGITPTFINTPPDELLGVVMSWAREFGPAFKLWSPLGTTVMLTQSATVEKVLSSQTQIDKGHDYEFVRPWLGDGLLISTGSKWGRRRKMLTPAFHFKILEDFLQVFNKQSKKMVGIVGKECLDGEAHELYNYVALCALDIICETAMGKTINAQEAQNGEYIQSIQEISILMQQRSFRPWLHFELIWKLSALYRRQQQILKVLHGFTEKVISEKKEEYRRQKSVGKNTDKSEETKETESIYFQTKKRLAFLDLLLEVQDEKGEGELSDLDIRHEVDTFMFEGHDTTSTNVSFTLYALGCYPEIQQKVQQELDDIFGDDMDREVTNEDMTRMKYLECVIKESLRMFPSVPFIQRRLNAELTLDDGRTIPSETTVSVFIFALHRDPEKFPKPDLFLPERWSGLGEGVVGNSNKDPFAFAPFSAGPRNCIGQKFAMMEEKVMISSIMRSYSLAAMIPPDELCLRADIILRSAKGLPIKFRIRKS